MVFWGNAGGTRQAEDGQAEPAVQQHSARTGMTSAKGSPSATVMNFVTEHTASEVRQAADRERDTSRKSQRPKSISNL